MIYFKITAADYKEKLSKIVNCKVLKEIWHTHTYIIGNYNPSDLGATVRPIAGLQ